MKATLIPFGLLGLFCCCLQADDKKTTPRERFLTLNPDYHKTPGRKRPGGPS